MWLGCVGRIRLVSQLEESRGVEHKALERRETTHGRDDAEVRSEIKLPP